MGLKYIFLVLLTYPYLKPIYQFLDTQYKDQLDEDLQIESIFL